MYLKKETNENNSFIFVSHVFVSKFMAYFQNCPMFLWNKYFVAMAFDLCASVHILSYRICWKKKSTINRIVFVM